MKFKDLFLRNLDAFMKIQKVLSQGLGGDFVSPIYELAKVTNGTLRVPIYYLCTTEQIPEFSEIVKSAIIGHAEVSPNGEVTVIPEFPEMGSKCKATYKTFLQAIINTAQEHLAELSIIEAEARQSQAELSEY